MRYRSLDTNLLVILDIILEQISVTKAADILRLSQPAVSNALSRLRDHFGDELIVQIGRQSVLTPFAERLRNPLKTSLQQTDAVVAMRAGFDPRVDTRKFSVVGSEYVGLFIINEVIRRATREAPGVSIIFQGTSSVTYEQFERGEIDMIVFPQKYAFDGHPIQSICEENYCCVVWADHPRIGSRLTMDEYMKERHIVCGSSGLGDRKTTYDELCLLPRGFNRNVAAQVPSFSEVGEVVVGTELIATIQIRLAKRMMRELPLRIVDVPLDFPPMVEVIQWHRYMDQDPGSSWLRKIVCDVAANI